LRELNIALKEWESVGPGDGDQGVLLEAFRFDDSDSRRIAESLTDSQTVEFRELYNGLHIRARSHVGRIKLGRLTLTITPKIGTSELLTLFRYAYGLADMARYRPAEFATSGDLFQDLVIAQLYSEVRELIERGIARSYLEVEEDLAAPRGRIDLVRLAKKGEPGTTLPCRHYPRSTDHLLNQVVLAGLGLAHRMAQDHALAASVGRQRRWLADLASPVSLSADLLARANRSLNRLVAPYEFIVRLVEILYFGSLVEMEGEKKTQRLDGFLFDMNLFFETLLLRFLSENLPGLQVDSQHGLTGMMRYVPGHNPKGRTAPRPRPDYAIRRRKQVLALLDAKYRDLWENSLPRDMLYQLSVYALSQPKGSTAAILYPTTASTASRALIEIREPSSGGTAGYVDLRPVLVGRIVELIEAEGPRGRAARETAARELAGLAN
jgi:5-methylcytosine-specific restriction enzyme subunit McrC